MVLNQERFSSKWILLDVKSKGEKNVGENKFSFFNKKFGQQLRMIGMFLLTFSIIIVLLWLSFFYLHVGFSKYIMLCLVCSSIFLYILGVAIDLFNKLPKNVFIKKIKSILPKKKYVINWSGLKKSSPSIPLTMLFVSWLIMVGILYWGKYGFNSTCSDRVDGCPIYYQCGFSFFMRRPIDTSISILMLGICLVYQVVFVVLVWKKRLSKLNKNSVFSSLMITIVGLLLVAFINSIIPKANIQRETYCSQSFDCTCPDDELFCDCWYIPGNSREDSPREIKPCPIKCQNNSQ